MGDANYPLFTEAVCLLLKGMDTEHCKNIITDLRKHENYIMDYDPDPEHALFIFSIPDEFKDDYKLFREGKYSRFSTRLKDVILGSKTSGKDYKILTKSESYRREMEEDLEVSISPDAELLDPPKESKEIYNYKDQ